MKKSLLVLEKMPEKCSECRFWFAKATMPVEYRCMANKEKLVGIETKPDWCPLIPMPERKKVMRCEGSHSVFDYELRGWQAGWNNCINAICVEAESKVKR